MAVKTKTKETMDQKLIITLVCIAIGVGGYHFYGRKMNSSTDVKNTKQTTSSGLAYEVITAPSTDALQPTRGQTVVVHYTGWLDDNGQPGAKFDSSVDRSIPFEFPVGVGHVIKGWDEALASMKVGEKRRIYLPSELGYGARGAGATIPPYANLIFDVELLDIKS